MSPFQENAIGAEIAVDLKGWTSAGTGEISVLGVAEKGPVMVC